jgi:hypothetical protein
MNPGRGQNADELIGLLCVVIGVVLVVALAIQIFYLLTLQKALSRVSPENRAMQPGMVWLELIPCFNLIWQFVIAIRVPDSLRNEFRARGRDDGSDYGKTIAIAQGVVAIASSFIGNGMRAAGNDMATAGSCISGGLSLVGLVLFIVFWVKVANYSNQLATDDGYPDQFRRRADDYFKEDRPKRDPADGSQDIYRPEDEERYH